VSVYTIAAVTLLYALTAFDMAYNRKDYPMAVVWAGYTLANFGFLAALR
jgi:hypothetical protein